MKKNYKIFLIALYLVLLTSCEFLFTGYDQQVKETEEPVYTPDYAWQLKLDGRQLHSQAYTEEKYFYLLEFIEENKLEKIRLVKIDMDTGKYIWKSSKIFSDKSIDFGFSDIVKLDDKIYYVSPKGNLYCHSDNDGSVKSVVQLGLAKKEAIANIPVNNIVRYKDNIYWISKGNIPIYKPSIFELDLSKINYDKAEELQIIEPKSLYSKEDWRECCFLGNPIIEDGVLYFITWNLKYYKDEGVSIIGAINLDTNNLIWETAIEKLHGLTENTLLVKDDILYVVNSSLLKVNKYTGKILLRHNDEDGDVYTRPSLIPSPYVCGIQCHEGRLYYTTIMSRDAHLQVNISKDLVYSLVCVDANSLEFVWGFHPVGGTSSTFPIIKDGKAYIVTHIDGLRVFDIKTGDLIGVDKSIIAWGEEKTFLYKNYYIFYNVDFKANRATLCAIKI